MILSLFDSFWMEVLLPANQMRSLLFLTNLDFKWKFRSNTGPRTLIKISPYKDALLLWQIARKPEADIRAF